MKPEFDWKDAEWLISEWGDTGPVALKGVASGADAKKARSHPRTPHYTTHVHGPLTHARTQATHGTHARTDADAGPGKS